MSCTSHPRMFGGFDEADLSTYGPACGRGTGRLLVGKDYTESSQAQYPILFVSIFFTLILRSIAASHPKWNRSQAVEDYKVRYAVLGH